MTCQFGLELLAWLKKKGTVIKYLPVNLAVI